MSKRFRLSPYLPTLPKEIQQKILGFKHDLELREQLLLDVVAAAAARDDRRLAEKPVRYGGMQPCLKCSSVFRMLIHNWPCSEHISRHYPRGHTTYYKQRAWQKAHINRYYTYHC